MSVSINETKAQQKSNFVRAILLTVISEWFLGGYKKRETDDLTNAFPLHDWINKAQKPTQNLTVDLGFLESLLLLPLLFLSNYKIFRFSRFTPFNCDALRKSVACWN